MHRQNLNPWTCSRLGLATALVLVSGPLSGCGDAGDPQAEETDTGTSAGTSTGSSTEAGATTATSMEGSTEGTETADPDTGSSESSTGADPGTVTLVPCRFEISDELTVDADYVCGDLTVPEQRGVEDGTEIAIHFVRFFGPDDSNHATIYLDGGPGASGQQFASLPAGGVEAFTQAGDFVVVAQRGTILSEPALVCPERAGGTALGALETCRDSLTGDGVELESYNTPANADDIEDLRLGLGYDAWNLFGISYGSRLALEVMRRHPGSVRSAVIDGVVPPEVNWQHRSNVSLWGAVQGMSAACDADALCSDTFGSFDQAFIDMITSLNADPIVIEEDGVMVSIDGAIASSVVARLLYVTDIYPLVPLIVTSLRDRNLETVGPILESLLGGGGSSLAAGMHWSVKCSDLFNPEVGPGVDAELLAGDVPEPLAELGRQEADNVIAVCELWPKPESDRGLATPIRSSIPTLVSSGSFDPITPPSFGALAADGLTNHREVVFANSGHGAVTESDCGQGLLISFIGDPQSTIDSADTTCTDEIDLVFVDSAAAFLDTMDPERRQALLQELGAARPVGFRRGI